MNAFKSGFELYIEKNSGLRKEAFWSGAANIGSKLWGWGAKPFQALGAWRAGRAAKRFEELGALRQTMMNPSNFSKEQIGQAISRYEALTQPSILKQVLPWTASLPASAYLTAKLVPESNPQPQIQPLQIIPVNQQGFWNQPISGLKDIPHIGEYLTPQNLGIGLGSLALLKLLSKD